MTAFYYGIRADDLARAWVCRNGKHRALRPRTDLFNHSPNGFEWGYGGSGPAQLALAILADALGDDDRAVQLHQGFKREVVAGFDTDEWRISEARVREVVATLEAERAGKNQ